MGVDAGTVESQIRLRLDNLSHDIMTVTKNFNTLGQNMLAGINRPSEKIKATVKSYTDEIEKQRQKMAELSGGKELKNYYKELEDAIKKAEKANDAEAWAIAQGQKEAAKEIEKTIKSLERQKEAAEKAVVKAQGNEEEARLAVINRLQETYKEKLEEINHMHKLGVITAEEKNTQIQAAQMQEIRGLEKLRTEYKGLDKEQEIINNRLKEQAGNITSSAQNTDNAVSGSFKNMSKTGINEFAKMAQGMHAAIRALPIIGLITAITAGIAKLVSGISAFLNKTADAYYRQQKELGTLRQIVDSTGASAWTSAGQLEGMAKSLSKVTGQSTNDIMGMQTRLLTYTNIVGENFNRAQKAALDMAAVMGMDVRSAAETLGKALDSPTEGLTALTRQGFRFKEEQKEQIRLLTEQGRVADAQALILADVEKAYNGAAEAQEKATGYTNRLKNAKEELNAELGRHTSRLVEWATKLKLGIMEARLAGLQQKRMGEEFEQTDKKVRVITEAIAQLNEEMSRTGPTDEIQEQMQRYLDELTRINNSEDRIIANLREQQRAYAELVLERQASAGAAQQQVQYLQELEIAEESIRNASLRRIAAQRQVEEALGATQRQNAERELNRAMQVERGAILNKESIQEALALLEEAIRRGNETTLGFDATSQALYEAETERLLAIAAGRVADAEAEERALRASQATAQFNIENNNREQQNKRNLDVLTKAATDAENKRKTAILTAQEALNKGMIDTEEFQKRRQQAYAEEAGQLAQIKVQMEQLVILEEEGDAGIERRDATIADLNAKLIQSTAAEKNINNIIARREALESYRDRILENEQAMRLLQVQRYGTVQEILEVEKDIARAKLESEKFYKDLPEEEQLELRQSLFDLMTAQASTEHQALEMKRDQENELESLRLQRALAQSKDTDEYLKNLAAIQEHERKIAKEKLENDATFRNANAETQQQMLDNLKKLEKAQAGIALVEMLADYENKIKKIGLSAKDALELQRAEALKTAMAFSDMGDEYEDLKDKINEYYDKLKEKAPFDTFISNTQEALNRVSQLFNAVSDMVLAFMKRDTENQKRELDERYSGKGGLLETLDKELQARLYNAGLASAATKEQHEQDLNNALATGNHKTIYEREKALERYKIEKDIADRREKLEEELKDKKAQLDFDLATAEWKAQLAQAYVSAAQAVLNVIASSSPVLWPFLIPSATIIGAAQIATVHANKPQKFAEGGIVPGSSFRGDNNLTLQDSGEMNITRKQQKELWDFIKNGSKGGTQPSQPIIVHLITTLDGKVIAESIAEFISNGDVFIQGRGIIR